MPGIGEKTIFSNQLLLPGTLLIGFQSVGLGHAWRSSVLQDIVIAGIDTGVAFDAFGVEHLSVEMENFSTHVDALGAGITAIAAAGALRHTGDFLLNGGDVHKWNHHRCVRA